MGGLTQFCEEQLNQVVSTHRELRGDRQPQDGGAGGDGRLHRLALPAPLRLAHRPKVHRDLTLIRKIRDRFARDFGAVSFASSDVAAQCGELWFPRNVRGYGEESGPKDPRGQFVFTVLLIFNLLITEMRDNKPDLRTSRFFST
jgi:hypothetical protein